MASRLELTKFQTVDSNGDPLSGGLLYTYIVGTTTAKATYTTAAAAVEQSNPIVLNARGESTVEGIYGVGFYKLVLKDSAGVTIWTIPSISGVSESGYTSIGDYSNDFDAAITAIAATETTLIVDSASTMSGVVTVPKTCKVIIEKGGSINQSTYGLTFNGPFECGAYYVFTGSGAVSFTTNSVQEVLPEWWGENTTPGTTDMTAEIQAAVDSITAGDVYYQHQTYLISAPIIPESSVNFVGCGTIKLGANADDDMFDITGADTDIGFYDLTFDGNGANQTRADTVNIINATTQVKRITIKNCTFKNAGSRAVLFSAGLAHEDIIVTGNRFIDYYANGVVFWGVIRGVISDNIFDNSAITPDGNGGAIGVGNISTDITVSGNSIDIGDSQVATFGIETGQAGTTRISITGNTINCRDYALNDGISIATTTNSVVSGNSITKAQYIGAIEVAGSSSISVTGNSILDVDTHGIAINDQNHTISVTGNVIDSFTKQGISVQKSTGGTTATIYGISIIGNTITNGTGASASGYHAIYVNGGPANGLIISNNIIYNHPNAFGINILADTGDSATGFIISGNIIYNVSTYWIAFAGGGTHTGHILTGNSVTTGGTALLTGTGYFIKDNFPDTEELTTGSPTLSRYLGTAYINSVGGAITGTLGSGYYIGQTKTIVMTEATTSSTITFTNMSETVNEPALINGTDGDGEVATFNAIDEAWHGVWTGTEWMTLRATCTFV